MARIAGVNIPQNKLVHIGLTYIYGIGTKYSNEICEALEISKSKNLYIGNAPDTFLGGGIQKSIELINNLNWTNGFYRKDIGYKVIK